MYSVQCSAVLCNHLWYYRHWMKSLFTCMYFDAITFLTLLRFVSSITFWYFLFISPMNWSTLSSEKGPLSYPKKPTHFKHSGFTITKLLRSCLHCVCITCKHSTDVMNAYLRKRQQQWFWKIYFTKMKKKTDDFTVQQHAMPSLLVILNCSIEFKIFLGTQTFYFNLLVQWRCAVLPAIFSTCSEFIQYWSSHPKVFLLVWACVQKQKKLSTTPFTYTSEVILFSEIYNSLVPVTKVLFVPLQRKQNRVVM